MRRVSRDQHQNVALFIGQRPAFAEYLFKMSMELLPCSNFLRYYEITGGI